MFNKKYKYHVAYNYNSKGVDGFGSVVCISGCKINSSESIQFLKCGIEKENSFDNIVILNIIKLR